MQLRFVGRGSLATILLVTIAQTSAFAQGPAQTKGQSEKVADRSGSLETLKNRIWWNQAAKIEKIKLTEEQRESMDRLLDVFLSERENLFEARAIGEFTVSLQAGDIEAASRAADVQAETYRQLVRAQMQLMMDVTDLLTEAQLGRLNKEFPALLRRDWVPTRTIMAARSAHVRRQSEQ